MVKRFFRQAVVSAVVVWMITLVAIGGVGFLFGYQPTFPRLVTFGLWALVGLAALEGAGLVVPIGAFLLVCRPRIMFFERRVDRLERAMRAVVGMSFSGLTWIFFTGAYPPGVPPHFWGEVSRWISSLTLLFFASHFLAQSARGWVKN